MSSRGVRMFGLWALAALCLSACTQVEPVAGPSPADSPAAVASAVTTTPSPIDERERFVALSRQYEEPLSGQAGLELLAPLLGDEPLPELDEDGLKLFDTEYLPSLRKALSQPVFLPPQPLRTGQREVNFRRLRELTSLVTRRAEIALERGQPDLALELVELPLALLSSLQQRPETVSTNLFSSGYVAGTLQTIERWVRQRTLDEKQLRHLEQALERHRPDYGHLSKTLEVDLAQLYNSLDDQETRELLGLGNPSPDTLQRWRQEILSVVSEGRALYRWTGTTDPEAFNQAVMGLSPEVQGLIIDYPPLAAMQKHSYARYLATELGLKAELARSTSKEEKPFPPTLKQLAEAAFTGHEGVEDLALALLDYRVEPAGVVFEVKEEAFPLPFPGREVVLFNSSQTPSK